MRLLPVVVVMLVLLAGPVARFASAGDPAVGMPCPAYGAHLSRARAYLARGERAGALTELRRARAALEACLREEAGEAHPLAGLRASSPAA